MAQRILQSDMFQQSFLHDSPTMFRRALVACAVAAVLVLLGWRIVGVLQPPALVLLEPATMLQSTVSPRITVRGTTEPGAAITINGVAYAPNAVGVFVADVVLLPGINTIAIEARRPHSRPARIERTINVHRADAPLARGGLVTKELSN